MSYCSHCGHENPPFAQVCFKCAATLGPRCPACEQPVQAGSRFCGHCGGLLSDGFLNLADSARTEQVQQALRALMPESLAAKINAAAIEIAGERRDVTVLSLGLTALSSGRALDSEGIYLLTDELLQPVAEVIYKYEGTIDNYTDSGLMAMFGAPVAHENDPERAVRAALEIQSVVQPLEKRICIKYGVEVQPRVGINTGTVVAGKVGDDLRLTYTVVGDTVDLADHLRRAAGSGSVLVSFTTFQRTRPLFEYEPIPSTTIEPGSTPVRAFRALGLRLAPSRVRGLLGLQVPMVGRRDALAQLRDLLTQASQRYRTQLVLLTGEAGVGKSRLLAEFQRSADGPRVGFFWGSCMAYARSQPMWLVASVLRDMMQLAKTDPAGMQRATLQAFVQQLDLSDAGVLPHLTNVLGLQQVDPNVELQLRRFDDTVRQKLTHAALRQVFLAQARRTPTVLVFDDLHWIDPASGAFLEHLIETVSDVPLLLVLVSRQVDPQNTVQRLVDVINKHDEDLNQIHLEPLSKVEGELLVYHLMGQTTDEAQALKQRIAARAEGNPFFVEEIVRMLIDQGALQCRDGTWFTTPQANELLAQIPGTLNGLILARLDRLPDDLRRTLQKASVLGVSFPLTLLQSLSQVDPATLSAHLDALQAQQFIIASRDGALQGFLFRHALIQEAVYGTLLNRDRKKIHQRAAQAIEQAAFWTPDERTEALAYHYAQAPDSSQAIPHLIAAGENAARRGAHEIAIEHYRRAVNLLHDGAAPANQEAVVTYGSQIVRAQIGLGQALKFVGEFAQAAQNLEGALQHLLRLSLAVDSSSLLEALVRGLRELADIRVREGLPEQAAAHLEAGLAALGTEGAQEHLPLWRILMDRLAWVRFRQSRLQEAFSVASSATLGLDVAREEDPVTLASLYNTLGGVFWQWGDLPEASRYVQKSLDLYEGIGYAWGIAIAFTNLGVLHYNQGFWPQAAEFYERALALRRENGYLPEQALNLTNLGLLRIALGEHAQAREDLEAGLALSQRLGEDLGIIMAEAGLAHLAVIQSRFEDAAAHIQAVLEVPDVAGEHHAAHALWLRGLVQAEQDELEVGLASVEQALEMARGAGLTATEADCRRALGILHARAGDHLEAELLLRESIDLCIQVNAPYDQCLALLELGRMYLDLARAGGDTGTEWRAKALTALNEAVEHFERLGAAHDLAVAHALLRQLPPRGQSHAKSPEASISTL